MELFIETELQEENGYFLVSLWAKEFATKVLMDKSLFQANQLDKLNNAIEDFNERPWKFPAWQADVSKALFAELNRLVLRHPAIKPNSYYDLIKAEKTPEEQAKQDAINKKIKASKELNKQRNLDNKALSASLKEKAAKANIGWKHEENYYPSGLYGFHGMEIYVEPSMGDDCFGFGEIKVQQTLDDDVESLYAFYDDYIF
jgi:hypothetical protein